MCQGSLIGVSSEFQEIFQLSRVFQKVSMLFHKSFKGILRKGIAKELFDNNDIYFRTKCLQKYNYNIEERHINRRPEKKFK